MEPLSVLVRYTAYEEAFGAPAVLQLTASDEDLAARAADEVIHKIFPFDIADS